jgi:hypothetical protein
LLKIDNLVKSQKSELFTDSSKLFIAELNGRIGQEGFKNLDLGQITGWIQF